MNTVDLGEPVNEEMIRELKGMHTPPWLEKITESS